MIMVSFYFNQKKKKEEDNSIPPHPPQKKKKNPPKSESEYKKYLTFHHVCFVGRMKKWKDRKLI